MSDNDWNIIDEAREVETPHGVAYLVRIRDTGAPWRVIGSSYRPQPGERMDHSRFAYMGNGKTLEEALAAWDRQHSGED